MKPTTDYDVILLGGAFSGASTALLLKRELPHLRVLILERKEAFDKKVGESTSEVAGAFLTRVLHKASYLAAHHVNKHGLRLWFSQPGHEDPFTCTEVGQRLQSRLPTYQLDRSKLDEHLLEDAVQHGCQLQRPALVKAIDLSSEPHGTQRVDYATADGTLHSSTCLWVLDASGKAALLARKLKLHTPLGDEHPTAALWTRYRKVNDLDSAATRALCPQFMQGVYAARSVATNHLMGHGWWCWLIPLSDGSLSVGLVWDHTLYDLPPGQTLGERLHTHLLTHPVGKLMFQHAQPEPGDVHYHKGLAYYSPQMAGQGWALLGDAAGFIDPLYSQGIDYCGHTISAVVGMLKKYFRSEDHSAEFSYLSGDAYGRSYRYWFEALYKDKYHYMGDAELMWAAFLLDLSTYFLGPVRLVITQPDYEWQRLPYDGRVGTFVAKFMAFYNRRLAHLAKVRVSKGIYGRRNLHYRHLLTENFTPNNKSLRLFFQGLRAWLRAEVSTLLAKPQPSQTHTPQQAAGTSTATSPAAP